MTPTGRNRIAPVVTIPPSGKITPPVIVTLAIALCWIHVYDAARLLGARPLPYRHEVATPHCPLLRHQIAHRIREIREHLCRRSPTSAPSRTLRHQSRELI